MAYSEILDDERKETAAGFWERANAFFASLGVTVTAVMTDNGSCYRSHAFAVALGENLKHKWTRPYRPQTNGKVERFNRTLATEWAYARPYTSETERTAAYETWLHRDDGCGSGADVTRNYTDAREGCLFVDLSVDAGVAAGRTGT